MKEKSGETWKEAGRTFIPSRLRRRYLRQVREQTAFDHRYDNALFSFSLPICVSFLFPSVLPFLCSRTPLTLYFASSCCFDTERSTERNAEQKERGGEVREVKSDETRRDDEGKENARKRSLCIAWAIEPAELSWIYIFLLVLFLRDSSSHLRPFNSRKDENHDSRRNCATADERKKKARETIMKRPRLVGGPFKSNEICRTENYKRRTREEGGSRGNVRFLHDSQTIQPFVLCNAVLITPHQPQPLRYTLSNLFTARNHWESRLTNKTRRELAKNARACRPLPLTCKYSR